MRWINIAFGLYFFISAIKAITKGKKKILVGTVENSEAIMNVSNEAFMADAFFKKPLYHQRFQLTDIMDMISSQSSAYLMITAPKATVAASATTTSISGNTTTRKVIKPKNENQNTYKANTSTGELQSSGHRDGLVPSDKDYNDSFDYKDDQNYNDNFDYTDDFKEDDASKIKSLNSTSTAYNATENIAGCCYLTWSTERNEDGKLIIMGKLSVVAVAKMYTR